MTSTKSGESSDAGVVGRLRAAARIAALSGAVGSVGLMLRAGRRNDSKLLLVLMAIWVLSPFVVLLGASVVAKSWPALTQKALYGVMLVIALGSLAIYGADTLWSFSAKAAFVFIVVPPASWLLTSTVVLIAALASRRQSRGD